MDLKWLWCVQDKCQSIQAGVKWCVAVKIVISLSPSWKLKRPLWHGSQGEEKRWEKEDDEDVWVFGGLLYDADRWKKNDLRSQRIENQWRLFGRVVCELKREKTVLRMCTVSIYEDLSRHSCRGVYNGSKEKDDLCSRRKVWSRAVSSSKWLLLLLLLELELAAWVVFLVPNPLRSLLSLASRSRLSLGAIPAPRVYACVFLFCTLHFALSNWPLLSCIRRTLVSTLQFNPLATGRTSSHLFFHNLPIATVRPRSYHPFSTCHYVPGLTHSRWSYFFVSFFSSNFLSASKMSLASLYFHFATQFKCSNFCKRFLPASSSHNATCFVLFSLSSWFKHFLTNPLTVVRIFPPACFGQCHGPNVQLICKSIYHTECPCSFVVLETPAIVCSLYVLFASVPRVSWPCLTRIPSVESVHLFCTLNCEANCI